MKGLLRKYVAAPILPPLATPAIAELAQCRQWVAWRYEERGADEKPTKVPVNPHTGGRAKVNADATWASYGEAVARATGDGLAGVGFVLCLRDQGAAYVGIDLDNVVRADGTLEPWANEIVDLAETYAEHSPSGRGIRLFARGITNTIGATGAGVEVYTSRRFLTVTGHHVPGTPTAIHPAPLTLEACRRRAEAWRNAYRATKRAENVKAPPANPIVEFTSTSLAEMAEILAYIPPDCPYGDWIVVGMGLHDKTGGAGNGVDLWDRWSAGGQKYPGVRELTYKWNSFRGSGVHFDSVCALAEEYGADLSAIASRHRGRPIAAFTARQSPERGAPANEDVDRQEAGKESDDAGCVGGSGAARPKASEASLNPDADHEPIDLWGHFDPPPIPREILPPILEAFAFDRAESMGCDAAGIAAATLAVCAAAIPDNIRVQVKRHDPIWRESARLWVALVGDPSTKKSPILRSAAEPLNAVDGRLFSSYCRERADYDALSADDRKKTKPPLQRRKRLEDTTIEAAQEVLADSHQGVLCLQDELSGFFGAMEKYGGKGVARDRAFWLQSFNGGEYAVNRVGRGAALIPNLSVCLLGGIQPDPIRRLAANAVDDGLIQRLLPIILRPSGLGKDEPASGSALRDYAQLLERLVAMEAYNGRLLQFTDAAQIIRRELEAAHLGAAQGFEAVNRKLGAHAGKLDGLFARLCVVFHCVEHAGSLDLPPWIGEDVARRVAILMRRFFLPHAIAFYTNVLGLADDHDRLTSLASSILVRRLTKVTARDVARMGGRASTQGLSAEDCQRLFEQLAALAWVDPVTQTRSNGAPACVVNPLVHQRFAERTERERIRLQRAREAMAEAFSGTS